MYEIFRGINFVDYMIETLKGRFKKREKNQKTKREGFHIQFQFFSIQ